MKISVLGIITLVAGCGGGPKPVVDKPAAAEPPAPLPPVRFTALSDVNRAAPGQEFTLAAQLDIEPGWHIYWTNSGGTGKPTDVRFSGPQGFSLGRARFPGPARIERAQEIELGYAERVLISSRVVVPEGVTGDIYRFRVEATWQACRSGAESKCENGTGAQDVEVVRASANMPSEPLNQQVFEEHERNLPKPLSTLANTRHDWLDAQGGHELVLYIDGGVEVSYFPTASLQPQVAGQALVPGRGVGALHISFTGAPETVQGVIRASDGKQVYFFALDMPGPGTAAKEPAGSP